MGKVAVVTGSGKRRMGRHILETLHAAGWQVVAHYRSSAAEAQELAARLDALVVQADLASEAEVKRFAAAVLERYGRVDALVNCAAVWEPKLLEQVTAADVIRNFEINLLGTFLTCQHFGLAMTRQPEGGCMINFGDWADQRPYTGYAAYFPSKAAIPGLTRMFAVELGTRNPKVRVNAILPGPLMLPPDLPEAERAEAVAATLLKREGAPIHAARAVLHFLENDYLTGVCLPVDGGRSIYANGY